MCISGNLSKGAVVMGFVPTVNQQAAITTIDCDLVVSAGAGSGKTKVLVERFIYLLKQGVRINEIVAITFTRKAALEMKERIRQALIAGDYSSDMVNVLEQAHISTIHGFCQRLIADHPLQAEVDPRFRVAEEWESRGLLYQVTQAQLAYALADGKQGIIELCESRQPGKIVDDLVDIYERMVSKGTKDFNVEDDSKYLVTEITILRQELIEKVEHWLPWVKTQSLTESKQQVVLDIEGLWSEYNAGLAEADIAAEADILNELKSKFGGNWAKALKTQVGELKDLCEELNQSLTDLAGLEKLVHISSLLNNIDQEYQQHKLTAGLLDYNDLERLAVKLLADDDVVKDTYQFRYIMVDEAQDINPIQKQIIDLLTKDQGIKLFIVGDPKQSIYRFRGAEVELFINSQEEILHKQGKIIALSDNFRSRPGIINFANQFFAPLLDGDLISYIPLIPNRDDTSCPAVELLITPRGENLDLDRQMEAERIAAYIQHLVYEQGYQYNEITVLFRTMTNVAIYERALQTRGIPFVNLSSWGFFEKQEIQDILSFVSWLQDSSDSISKIAVLRSPFFGVSDIGLYWYQADKPQMISDLDWEKINAAHQLYPKLQQALASLPAPRFLEKLLAATEFCKNTLSLPMGEQRLANIHKLQDTSWQLWAKDYNSLTEQLNYIEQIIEQRGKEGEARLDNESSDVVTFMTVHGSKGLEFPVVILADLCSNLRLTDSGYLEYHPQYGLTIKETSKFKKIKELLKADSISEAKRLLYVAVTRAVERLVLSGIGGVEDYRLNGPVDDMKTWWEWILWALRYVDPDLINVMTETKEVEEVIEIEDAATACEQDEIELIPVEALPVKYTRASFSVTSLMIYSQCPRRYYYRYILRVPEIAPMTRNTTGNGLDPLQRGNIVHRVCEHLRSQTDKMQLLEWAISMEGITLRQAEKLELLKIIDDYTKSSYYRHSIEQQVEYEMEFSVPINQFIITGTVDQIIHDDAGLKIMDLKTNQISKEQVPEIARSYYWQLNIYAWAVHKLTNKPVVETGLYFLFPDVIYQESHTELQIAETEKWLLKTCDQIQKGEAVGADAFPIELDCMYCPYNCDLINQSQVSFAEILKGLGTLD